MSTPPSSARDAAHHGTDGLVILDVGGERTADTFGRRLQLVKVTSDHRDDRPLRGEVAGDLQSESPARAGDYCTTSSQAQVHVDSFSMICVASYALEGSDDDCAPMREPNRSESSAISTIIGGCGRSGRRRTMSSAALRASRRCWCGAIGRSRRPDFAHSEMALVSLREG